MNLLPSNDARIEIISDKRTQGKHQAQNINGHISQTNKGINNSITASRLCSLDNVDEGENEIEEELGQRIMSVSRLQ
jgi:hypothetical protein